MRISLYLKELSVRGTSARGRTLFLKIIGQQSWLGEGFLSSSSFLFIERLLSWWPIASGTIRPPGSTVHRTVRLPFRIVRYVLDFAFPPKTILSRKGEIFIFVLFGLYLSQHWTGLRLGSRTVCWDRSCSISILFPCQPPP